jgi:hypothetical protein
MIHFRVILAVITMILSWSVIRQRRIIRQLEIIPYILSPERRLLFRARGV